MSEDDVLDAFVVAAAVRAADVAGAQRAWTVDAAQFEREAERQLRAAIMAKAADSNAPIIAATATGKCTPECRAYTQHYDVRVYACHETATPSPARTLATIHEPSNASALLHACIERAVCGGVADATLAAWHERDITDEVAAANIAVVGRRELGGGAFWCRRHTRLHVCSSDRCIHTIRTGLGFHVCVLSGRTMANALSAGYNQGTQLHVAGNDWNRSSDADATAPRRADDMAIDRILRTNAASAAPTPSGAEPPAHVDVDAPADDLFPDTLEENTFGNGTGGELSVRYAQAYASTFLLMFSEQRNGIEARMRAAAVADAHRRIGAYITAQRKVGQPIILTVCRQLERRVFNARIAYPEMLVPKHATGRMTAYFSLIVVEFYLQLMHVMIELQPRLSEYMTAVVDRLKAQSFVVVAPNILDLVHEGVHMNDVSIIDAEVMLTLFPDAQTLEELGFKQGVCTDVKKMLKKCIVAATSMGVAVERLQTTSLDMLDIIAGTESVVSMFLERRGERIGLYS